METMICFPYQSFDEKTEAQEPREERPNGKRPRGRPLGSKSKVEMNLFSK